MALRDDALKLHKDAVGKIALSPKVKVVTKEDLSLAYSPGVAEPCKEIHREPERVYEYTSKSNLVAVVSNGTAVLGLGDIGPAAAMPVMEGKAVLFKSFAGVDAWPLCIDAQTVDEVVAFVKAVAPTFGGINLEDIAAPACFEIEERLKAELDIPVFHDDQHGTAIVTMAAVLNALIVAGKRLEDVRIVVSGAGAAGIATVNLLLSAGAKHVVMCDTKGAIYEGRGDLNTLKHKIAAVTNPDRIVGDLARVLEGADLFIGVSAANAVTKEMVHSMNRDPILFAMANPDPEITPADALAAGALVIGTGRSDYPNQVNNVLAFPGMFRGALDTRAKEINEAMKVAAAHAIANLVTADELSADYVIPRPFDPRVAPAVAQAVAEAALATGVARIRVEPSEIALRTRLLSSIR
ncbi:NAD(P)-dependent malic enzyme [Ferroacidibacillus organovorans]|uniref:Malate dehydrogenase n=1 Tax=Ferroacidibacillus organovorans TaxID=1765683 RepID=A0A162UDS9_9BACL|nr:malic enzyme-like NAD(P)-binding protein [Ferroacidibacillus organovorans]KYP81674.1 malate dehydrogenase [Ferroacidibacillus organovorans]OAG94131.1 malate dehydrogenase [Ferroacidibacillus organovorans]OPG15341.1 NAD-dependent malic enzyme [Ferroacidibacillus organovorans]